MLHEHGGGGGSRVPFASETAVFSSLRGYNGKKLSDNIQCEIFQTILEEALENYSHSIVHELGSNFPEDLERNIDTVCQYVSEFV